MQVVNNNNNYWTIQDAKEGHRIYEKPMKVKTVHKNNDGLMHATVNLTQNKELVFN